MCSHCNCYIVDFLTRERLSNEPLQQCSRLKQIKQHVATLSPTVLRMANCISLQNCQSARAHIHNECVDKTNEVLMGMKLFHHVMLVCPGIQSDMEHLQTTLLDLGVYKLTKNKESESISLFFLHCTFPLLETLKIIHAEHSGELPVMGLVVVDLDDDLYT